MSQLVRQMRAWGLRADTREASDISIGFSDLDDESAIPVDRAELDPARAEPEGLTANQAIDFYMNLPQLPAEAELPDSPGFAAQIMMLADVTPLPSSQLRGPVLAQEDRLTSVPSREGCIEDDIHRAI